MAVFAKYDGVDGESKDENHDSWIGGDPNPGTAFLVDGKGGYSVQQGYFYYKHLSRAGQPGMVIAHVSAMDSEIGLVAFSRNGTHFRDAFIVINLANRKKDLEIDIQGCNTRAFTVFRTSHSEHYEQLEVVPMKNSLVYYQAPEGSVTTFLAE